MRRTFLSKRLYSSKVDIAQEIMKLVEEWKRERRINCAFDVGSGQCDAFAYELEKRVPGSESGWEADFHDPISEKAWEEAGLEPFDGHYVVKYNNRYYDAETPEGVDHWIHLPYFERKVRGIT